MKPARRLDPALLEPLQQARAAGELREVDLYLARHLLSLAPGAVDARVAQAIARLSRAQGDGDLCLDLANDAALRTALLASGLTAAAGVPAATPLVLDAGHRLYLRKYFVFEQQVAQALLARAVDAPLAPVARITATLATLPGAATTDPQQQAAARIALDRQLTVITGGPGTGKTTTVTRILAAMLALHDSATAAWRIQLAAPTGKAAARLGEAVRDAKAKLLAAGADPLATAHIPEDAQTLHRLLGIRPDTRRPRHDADNPLPLDVLVIDEASMIDLPLMARTLAALPPDARLVLLGDPRQLASVEAGNVLGDICHGLRDGQSALRGSLVQLLTSHRFRDDSGIGALARAINSGDAVQALALATTDSTCSLHERDIDELVALAASAWREIFSSGDVVAAARCLDRFRVLCALREGSRGVLALNARIEQALVESGLVPAENRRDGNRHYLGRPLLVTANDHGIALYNGDVGIVWPGDDGVLRACFVAADGSVRRLPLARLPEHETCFAMTVHKSQGSEFDRVALVLPDEDIPLLGRELVYTGITRAKTSVSLWASRAVLGTAIGRRVERSSGLRDALWQQQRAD